MARFRMSLLCAALLTLLPPASGAKPATPLTLRDTNGALHRPFEIGSNKAVVLIFIADDCPISNGYAPLINRLVAAYTPRKIAFSLVSTDTGVPVSALQQHDAQYGYRCPDLVDADRALAKRVGAKVTPEAFVYGPGGRLLYQGRIDDKYAGFGQVRFQPTRHDLQQALDAVAAGKPVPHPSTKAVGCFL